MPRPPSAPGPVPGSVPGLVADPVADPAPGSPAARAPATGTRIAALAAAALVALAAPGWGRAATGFGPRRTEVRLQLGDHVAFAAPGDYRGRTGYVDPYPVDGGGRVNPRDRWGARRLRVEPTLEVAELATLAVQLDVWQGLAWADTGGRDHLRFRDESHAAVDLDGVESFRARQLWLELRHGGGRIRVGRQAPDWGLGLVSRSGDGYPDDWSVPRRGDVVDRVEVAIDDRLLGGAPGPPAWTLRIAYDEVVDDERTRNLEDADLDPFRLFGGGQGRGDRARRAVASLELHGEPIRGGLYLQRRHDELGRSDVTGDPVPDDRDDARLWIADGWARVEAGAGEGATWFAEGELAWITGTGEHAVTDPHLDAATELEVDQLGYLVRVGRRSPALDLELELGFASGDDDPFDDRDRAFRFDRETTPGLVLFEEVLDARSATAAFHLADPDRVQAPPPSADAHATQGAVAGAIYGKATARWRPHPAWEARLALLHARAEDDLVDPFASSRPDARGRVGSSGAPASRRELGWEVDLGLRFTWDLRVAHAIFDLQGGWLVPGHAFDDAAGRRMDGVGVAEGRIQLLW